MTTTKPSKLKEGAITNYNASEEECWRLIHKICTPASIKQGTYKFGFLRAILDNLPNSVGTEKGLFISYDNIFLKFTENYWDLVVHKRLLQSEDKTRCHYSRLESILLEEIKVNPKIAKINFNSVPNDTIRRITQAVKKQCSTCVIGSLYKDLEGCIYSFKEDEPGITLSPKAFVFLEKYDATIKNEINHAWAEYIQKLNPSSNLQIILDTLEERVPSYNEE